MQASPLRAITLLPYQRRWVEDDSPLKIVVKARQIGYSFAATLRAVLKCLERRTTWVFLSKGERQSRLLMEKVQDHIHSCGIVARTQESTFFEGTSLKQLEVRFSNGSVIYGLPANPDTARGYSGHVTLDEFAFHADADKIYAALFPSITRGYGLEVISTPNGTQGKFYELAKAAGLAEPGLATRDSGLGLSSPRRRGSHGIPPDFIGTGMTVGEPSGLPREGGALPYAHWSAHFCDLYDALRQGLKIDVALLRAGCEDETAWQQEFCCQFVSTAENFLPPDLLAACLSAEATTDFPLLRQAPLLTGLGPASAPRISEGSRQSAEGSGRAAEIENSKLETSGPNFEFPISNFQFFLGIDIGRRHDRTVFWVDEVLPLASGSSTAREAPEFHEVLGARFQVPGKGTDTSHLEPSTSRVAVTRLVRTMANTPFAEQLQYAREVLRLEGPEGHPLIRRACIDATGMGAPLAEALAREFGTRVEPVVFTAALKEDLAFRTKRRMEGRLTLLPDTREIRRAFSAVKKFVTPSGNLRFDAERTDAGHADEFWAKALADLAADSRPGARATDAFLADAVPLVSPMAFAVGEANWPEWVM